jgi:hypothetical protein
MCLKVLPHQIKHLEKDFVPERIEDLVAFLSAVYDLSVPQDSQMLRHVGLLHAEPVLNCAG